MLNAAVAATVAIALVEAAAGYASAYSTASVGQWVAHDLRQTLYAHLQRLSLSFHERRQVGPLISTITDDVRAVQDFASQSLVSMVVDVLTIVGVLVVMFSLNWNFTLIALSVTPLLALLRLPAAPPRAGLDPRRAPAPERDGLDRPGRA